MTQSATKNTTKTASISSHLIILSNYYITNTLLFPCAVHSWVFPRYLVADVESLHEVEIQEHPYCGLDRVIVVQGEVRKPVVKEPEMVSGGNGEFLRKEIITGRCNLFAFLAQILCCFCRLYYHISICIYIYIYIYIIIYIYIYASYI